ncbi:hypothetical protein [Paraburkholderia aromaticivorans]|uniref:hypothetical protein n=1 Tax=Paraburkholderia aromaticivorans TaxID=2026199 RepID=UPI0038B9ABFD
MTPEFLKEIETADVKLEHIKSKLTNMGNKGLSLSAYQCNLREENDKETLAEARKFYQSLSDDLKPYLALTMEQVQTKFDYNMQCYASNPNHLAGQIRTLQDKVKYLEQQVEELLKIK